MKSGRFFCGLHRVSTSDHHAFTGLGEGSIDGRISPAYATGGVFKGLREQGIPHAAHLMMAGAGQRGLHWIVPNGKFLKARAPLRELNGRGAIELFDHLVRKVVPPRPAAGLVNQLP